MFALHNDWPRLIVPLFVQWLHDTLVQLCGSLLFPSSVGFTIGGFNNQNYLQFSVFIDKAFVPSSSVNTKNFFSFNTNNWSLIRVLLFLNIYLSVRFLLVSVIKYFYDFILNDIYSLSFNTYHRLIIAFYNKPRANTWRFFDDSTLCYFKRVTTERVFAVVLNSFIEFEEKNLAYYISILLLMFDVCDYFPSVRFEK